MKSAYTRHRLPIAQEDLPPALKRAESGNAIASAWRGIRDNVYSGQSKIPYTKLPRFAAKLGKLFWDASEDEVLAAILRGDPAWFVPWLIRLDQIDCAMIAAGCGLGDRDVLIRCRFTLQGFLEAAETRLKRNGGSWPPTSDAATQE